MQFFSVLQQARSAPKPAVIEPVEPPPVEAQAPELKPESCGWYDSSFDLAAGLEISEQDDDLLYQLCQVFLH
ncbi:MAG: hypothetical protein EOP35_25695 [Rubrivivax sp.]|nr:MAG: hypothetical protein EOP35_25695 [Rubrivivax sp.]